MDEPNQDKIVAFATPEELGRWLRANHMKVRELWVKMFKKKTGIPSVVWNDVVIQALRRGWINGRIEET